MGKNIVATERVCPAVFWSVEVEPPSSGSESEAVFSLSRGEALIFVLLLSFGLWAAIGGLSPCWLRSSDSDLERTVGDGGLILPVAADNWQKIGRYIQRLDDGKPTTVFVPF